MPSEPATHVMDDPGQPPADPGSGAPPAPPGPTEATSVSTLLRTAATSRPLEEVAALVELLRRGGVDAHHGDEALRVAAVDRPVSEVGPLVALLDGTPTATASAHQALRAAALGRSVEEVAQLIASFGARGGDGATAPAGAGVDVDATGAPLPPEAAGTVRIPVDADSTAGPEGQAALAGPAGVAPGGSRAAPGTDTVAAPAVGGGASAEWAPPAPAAPPGVGMPTAVPVTWGTQAHGQDSGYGGAPGPRNGREQTAALRLVLRWPAAVALAACGLSHLPVAGMTQLQFGRPADVLSLAITGGCLLLAVCLAVRDTAAVWTTSATAAVAVIVLHLVSRVGVVNPLRSVLGDAVIASELLAVTLAFVSAGLAAAALASRRRRVPATAAGA